VEEHATPDDDARLLAGLAAGHETAFTALYERFGTRLYRAALGLVDRREDAEDCVQEVFAALVRSHQRLSDVRDLAAYLFASLRRQAARRVARRAHEPMLLSSEPAEPAGPLDDPRAESLRRALGRLTAEQREVIALKVEGQLTFSEIACTLAISANTAASRYRYALAHLRDLLKE
jgi:RNA polymerase sigma-70 factor, ECF subfamily